MFLVVVAKSVVLINTQENRPLKDGTRKTYTKGKAMRNFKVLIDDFRDDNDEHQLPRMDLIIRNNKAYELVKPILKNLDFVLYADHDLGIDFNTCEYERNGYKILMDMIEAGIYPVAVYVITANPVGRHNIELALHHEGYRMDNETVRWTRVNP